MPKQVKVKLGGREYVITEKVMGVALKWRETLRQTSVMQLFESLDGALASIAGSFGDIAEGDVDNRVKLVAGINIATIAPALMRGLANSMDDVILLLFDYSVELKNDREWLEANAYNDEIIRAFVEVLKLNFPIMALWELVVGSRVQPIATNLPTRNGASGTSKPTAKQKSR